MFSLIEKQSGRNPSFDYRRKNSVRKGDLQKEPIYQVFKGGKPVPE
jgi:hypothetical protein